MKRNSGVFIPAAFVIWSVLIQCGLSNAFGAEVYSKDDTPFGAPLDVWMDKWWIWWITTTIDEATPKPDGCIINKSDSMVMLMETTVTGKPHQLCKISASQGLIIPIWTAFAEASIPEYKNYSYEQLSREARTQGDLGAITSLVKVDNTTVAKLDVVSSLKSGQLDYKINAMNNVTEIYSKGFNITIPEDTHMPDQNAGTWRSGAHGWLVFLKPLPPGDHTIYYNVGVSGLGADDHSSEITYRLQVE